TAGERRRTDGEEKRRAVAIGQRGGDQPAERQRAEHDDDEDGGCLEVVVHSRTLLRSATLVYTRISRPGPPALRRMLENWQKGWDLNPRRAHTLAGFQDRCL